MSSLPSRFSGIIQIFYNIIEYTLCCIVYAAHYGPAIAYPVPKVNQFKVEAGFEWLWKLAKCIIVSADLRPVSRLSYLIISRGLFPNSSSRISRPMSRLGEIGEFGGHSLNMFMELVSFRANWTRTQPWRAWPCFWSIPENRTRDAGF